MFFFEVEPKMSKTPDRPLECSECKKKISVKYTLIVDGQINHTAMCKDCPTLENHLKGTLSSSQQNESNQKSSTLAGLCCGNCETTLDSVKTGNALGCPECYEIFYDVLLQEASQLLHLPESIKKSTKSIHIGRSPGEQQEISSSVRLLALNEALNETLAKEDYEQAAWLRDQIKAITEKIGHGNQSK
jgi:protein arginine kinase activator